VSDRDAILRIDIAKGIDPKELAEAETAFAAPPRLPELPNTEANPEWFLLYEHVREGQISPEQLRRMRNRDLERLLQCCSLSHLQPTQAFDLHVAV
jgi:hypothetical protein